MPTAQPYDAHAKQHQAAGLPFAVPGCKGEALNVCLSPCWPSIFVLSVYCFHFHFHFHFQSIAFLGMSFMSSAPGVTPASRSANARRCTCLLFTLLLLGVIAGTPRLGTLLATGAGGASSPTTTLLSQFCRTIPLLALPLKIC